MSGESTRAVAASSATVHEHGHRKRANGVGAAFGSSVLKTRMAQAFPVLDARELERVRRFGLPRQLAAGTPVYEAGKPSAGVFVLLSGTIRITVHDGHGHDINVVDHHRGSFTGELTALSARRALVDGVAVQDVDALFLDERHLRSLIISDAALGEKIMRAMILRRVALIEAGFGGATLVGSRSSSGVAQLQGFLRRNGIPTLLLDPATEPDAQAFVDRYAPLSRDLPLAVCPDGTVFRNPTQDELARCMGMTDGDVETVYDVAIVGAGPAGLAAAVYAASEGLSTIVIDARAFGGQAGASERIENYFGFPTGISGFALTGRAYTQAQKFGVRMLIPAEVTQLMHDAQASAPFTLELSDGRVVHACAVVVASGAHYRRPTWPNVREMEGRGVWYWASPIEASMCTGHEVAIVGGGNSAGQAAVFLASRAAKVWMLVRGPGLAASMSQYLVERIAATSNIEVLTHTEITELGGTPESGVESVTWRTRGTLPQTRPIRHVFLFLGADPETKWLAGSGVMLDAQGFVITGVDARWPLATSIPGAFAIGDVRAGSVKRVGSAIGEGANVVSQIHAWLATAPLAMLA